ncbi:hypothetical protein HDU92_000018 [Lobulomyces angularis]|nr:hypothetical protein HDU92_000018 [Lobulomyces angularis]
MTANLINTVDQLLADLNDVIYDLKEEEETERTKQLMEDEKIRLNNKELPIPPQRNIYNEKSMQSNYQPQQQKNGPTVLNVPKYEPRSDSRMGLIDREVKVRRKSEVTLSPSSTTNSSKQFFPELHPGYVAPKDKTLSTISTLPDAFGGWLQKVSYNFLKSRSLKKKYMILANCALYIFSKSDEFQDDYEDCYPITNLSNVRVSEKGTFVLEFYTEWTFTRLVDETNQLGLDLKETVTQKKNLELQCKDKDEMLVWLDCFREVIDEARMGRTQAVADHPNEFNSSWHTRSGSQHSVTENFSPRRGSSSNGSIGARDTFQSTKSEENFFSNFGNRNTYSSAKSSQGTLSPAPRYSDISKDELFNRSIEEQLRREEELRILNEKKKNAADKNVLAMMGL